MTIIYKISGPNNIPCVSRDYVGQTSETLMRRWNTHKTKCKNYIKMGNGIYLHEILSTYGIENFTIDTIKVCIADTADERESYWITELNTIKPNGYNMESGGISSTHHPETIDKRAASGKKGLSIGLPTYINNFTSEAGHGYQVRYRPTNKRKNLLVPLGEEIPDSLLVSAIAALQIFKDVHAKSLEIGPAVEFIYNHLELQTLPKYIQRTTTKVNNVVTRHGFLISYTPSKKTKMVMCSITINVHHDMYIQAIKHLEQLIADHNQKLAGDQQLEDGLINLTL